MGCVVVCSALACFATGVLGALLSRYFLKHPDDREPIPIAVAYVVVTVLTGATYLFALRLG